MVNLEYKKHLSYILTHGTDEESRGLKYRECIGLQYRLDPKFPILTLKSRKMGYKFMFAEAAWILSGRNDAAYITKYSKYIWEFSDNGLFYFGAYGPKIIDQLSYVIKTLKDDIHSRQAYMNIWRESPMQTKDMPCSTGVQFLIRKNELHTIWNMRSSDAILGLVYDQFNVSMLSYYICLILRETCGYDVRPYRVTFNLGSAHIYDKDLKVAQNILDDTDEPAFNPPAMSTSHFKKPQELIDVLTISAETFKSSEAVKWNV